MFIIVKNKKHIKLTPTIHNPKINKWLVQSEGTFSIIIKKINIELLHMLVYLLEISNGRISDIIVSTSLITVK